MFEQDLKELIEKVKKAKAEFQNVELKKCKDGVTERLFDTLSSFSNQDDGGVIIFGIDESSNYEITGIDDVQIKQKKVMEQCQQMEPAVRAVFTVTEADGRNIVAAEIPPVDITERPCFYKGKGRIKGSYVRVGDADIPMNEYEVYSYEAYRKKYQDERREVERAEMSSLDENKLAEYLLKLKLNKPNLSRLDDQKIIELMSIEKNGHPTLAAELLLGSYPQAYFMQLGIIAVSVPGTEIGETDIDGSRFIDNQRIEGTIPEMLDAALAFVRKNTRTKTIIDPETGKRRDRSDYPQNAVREAILNALVHRDYSIHTEGTPIYLKIFSDRFELSSPGGLYGRLTLNTLGHIQPDTRNPVIANALEVMGISENRYSGIPTIRRELASADMPEPEFRDQYGEFTVIFRLTDESSGIYDPDSREAQIINFCKTPRTRKELAQFLGLSSATYAIKTYIQPLIDRGLIKLQIPDRPASPNQKYYS